MITPEPAPSPSASRSTDSTDAVGLRRTVRAAPRAGVVLDFDGVLAPIVADPAASRSLPGTDEVLSALAERFPLVALLSGRPVDFLAERVGADGVVLLGSYGTERRESDGSFSVLPSVARWESAVATARASLEAELAGEAGVHVEDKRIGVAVHWRRSPDHDHAAAVVRGIVGRVAERAGLVAEAGKLVAELRPPVGEDKGTALRRVVAEFELDTVLYAGDDVGDLPAFRAAAELGGHSLVVVGDGTAAEVVATPGLHLDGPAAVHDFLVRLVDTSA